MASQYTNHFARGAAGNRKTAKVPNVPLGAACFLVGLVLMGGTAIAAKKPTRDTLNKPLPAISTTALDAIAARSIPVTTAPLPREAQKAGVLLKEAEGNLQIGEPTVASGDLLFIALGAVWSGVVYGETFDGVGWSLGNANQNGWLALPPPRVTVSASYPYSSPHSLEFHPSGTTIGEVIAQSPAFENYSSRSTLTMRVRMNGYGGPDYFVTPQDLIAQKIVTRVDLAYNRNILLLVPDAANPGFGKWIDTGADWPVGQYFELAFDVDGSTNKIRLKLNGSEIYLAEAFSSVIDNLVFRTNNYSPDIAMYVDDIRLNACRPTAPGTPVDNGACAYSPSWCWEPASDPECGIASYYVEIGTSPGANDIAHENVGNITCIELVDPSPYQGQTLYVRVLAVNTAGNISEFSASSDGVLVDRTPPAAPGVPVDNGTCAYEPSWCWEPGSDPDCGGIASYYVEIGTAPGTNDVAHENVGNTTCVRLVDPSLYSGRTLYARVLAINAAGTVSEFSASSDGVLVDRTPPIPPGTPVDNGTCAFEPSWCWEPASDPDCGGIAGYYVEIGTSPGANDVAAENVGNTTCIHLVDPSPYQGRTLYARVLAVNIAGGVSEFSASSDGVLVDRTLPTPPGTPVDNGTCAYKPSWCWQSASDPDCGGIDSYYVEIGTSPGANDVAHENVGNINCIELVNPSPYQGQTLYARVLAVNNAGGASEFSPSSDGVMVDQTPPSPPGAISDNGDCSTGPIRLEWTAGADPECGVAGYYLEVGTAPEASDVASGPVAAGRLFYEFPDLSAFHGSTIYARVRSLNHALSVSAFTASSDGIVIDVTPPGRALAPIDGGQCSASEVVTFVWSASEERESAIKSYNLQVGTSPGTNDVFDGNVGNVLQHAVSTSGGTLYARIQAVNTCGLVSDWSEISDGITVEPGAPTAPGKPMTPDLVGRYSISPRVKYTWTPASSASGINSYNLQVGTYPGGANVFNANVGNVLEYTITAGHGQTLYARVQAVSTGLCSSGAFSEVSNLMTVDLSSPAAPGRPTAREGCTSMSELTFEWPRASDPQSGIASYDLEVGTSPESNDVFDANVGDVGSKVISAAGQHGKRLFARVRALNNAGNPPGPWSLESVGVLVDTTVPAAMAAPTDAGDITASPVVRFNWLAGSDPECGVSSYNLQVGTAPNTTDVFDGNVGNVLTWLVQGIDGQTLFSRVQAINLCGSAGAFSPHSDGITIDSRSASFEYQPVVVAAPTSCGAAASDTLPASLAEVTPGGSFVVEFWAKQIGSPLAGLNCVYSDLAWDPIYFSTGSPTSLSHSACVPVPWFNYFPNGAAEAGRIIDFGGCTMTGNIGVSPQWVLIGAVQMRAAEAGAGLNSQIQLQPSVAASTALAVEGPPYSFVVPPERIIHHFADVRVSCVAPSISIQPVSALPCEGQPISLCVTPGGLPAPNCQWQKNVGGVWNNVIGATSPCYTVDFSSTTDSGQYRCRVWNYCGEAFSDAVFVSVRALPAILTSPVSRSVCAGESALFEVQATGSGIGYQWQVSTDEGTTWTEIVGATGPTCQTGPLTALDNGKMFCCVITGECGTLVSESATVHVVAPPAIVHIHQDNGSVRGGATSVNPDGPASIQARSKGITGCVIQFNEDVYISLSDLRILSLDGLTDLTLPYPPVYNAADFTLTLTWPAATFRNMWLRIHVLDTVTSKKTGCHLDGEVYRVAGNPLSGLALDGSLPSGNGIPGGTAMFVLGALTGDVNGDRQVRANDQSIVRNNLNSMADIPSDINGDGQVRANDQSLVRNNLNATLPSPVSPASVPDRRLSRQE